FRALKEGEWCAESVARLTHDEFFEIINAPEMTMGPDPLIRKRDGCHRWMPEEFGSDDPRHGWTWEHCWQDAVTLLGGDEAVEDFIAGEGLKRNRERRPQVEKAVPQGSSKEGDALCDSE